MISKTKLFIKTSWPIATRLATLHQGQKKCYPTRNSEILTCHIIYKQSIASIHREFSTNIHGTEPRKYLHNTSLGLRPLNFFQNTTRTFFFHPNKDKPKKSIKRIPKLILLQNPFRWMMNKIDFSVLRRVWDPEFQEKEFRFGAKQAISRVTQVISGGQYSELNGLLTKAARTSLLRELDSNWNEKQRSLLALKREDIQVSSPRKVYFIRIGDKKFCDVDMAFLAIKWEPINNIDALLFAEIFARFHREYTPNCIPEWTIAYFRVTRFEVLRR